MRASVFSGASKAGHCGLLAALSMLWLQSCSTADTISTQPVLSGPPQWESTLYREHRLAGSIWDTRSGALVSPAELVQALLASRYVLIGEKHDNPDHHRLQLNLLEYLLASERVNGVSMEMMDTTFDTALVRAAGREFESLAELKAFLQWDEEGWDWSFYGPLVRAILQAGVPLRSANIDSQRMQVVYGQPLEAAVAAVLDAGAVEQLNIEIDESHCNMLPASQFPAMVRVQQARDHAMARSLADSAGAGAIDVLIAGNYHIRQDLGVPNYLLALDRSVTREDVVSLAILEVSPESNSPRDYLQAYSSMAAYDFVWFTPAVTDTDYCASFRQ